MAESTSRGLLGQRSRKPKSYYLFEEPLDLKVAKGVWAKVPAPAAFTIHKLIIATLFNRANKKEKDIRQAVYAGKYVLSDRAEMKKMIRLWAQLPRPWKRKVGRALVTPWILFPSNRALLAICKPY